jgi:hypothetical protein
MSPQIGARIRRAVASALLAGVLMALPPDAAASLGTGVGASPIMLAQAAIPGHAYKLPGLYVLNTGTVRSRYHVRVQRLSPGNARTLPATWVTLQQNDFVLRPHHSATVPFTITIPKNAASGKYLSDLVASTSSARRAGGTALGAAAATKIGLSVGATPGSIPWGTIGLLLLGAIALTGATYGLRRSGLHVRLERG